MKNPLVSCIIPVFNGELYLEESIESVLSQTYQPLQVIVVDDGSTDRTPDIIASYGHRICYLRQDKAGPWVARNLGLTVASGELVAFQDADDVWHSEKLARQMARFNALPRIDMCFTHIQNFWIPALKAEAERFRNHPISRPLPGYTCPTLLTWRYQFDHLGFFDETLNHATVTDWVLRAIRQGAKTEILSDVLVFRRLHHTNYSRVAAPRSRDEYLQFVKTMVARRRTQKEQS